VLNLLPAQPEKASKSSGATKKLSPHAPSSPSQILAHFCKYCGTPHRPQSDFTHLQDKCRKRMKLSDARPLNSCKVYTEDFATFEHPACSTCQSNDFHHPRNRVQTDEPFETVLRNCIQAHDKEIQTIRSILKSVDIDQDEENMQTNMAFLHIMNRFTESLVKHSVEIFKEQQSREPASEGKDKILVPLHVYQALIKCEQFEFLCDNLKTKNVPGKKRRKKE
jgi:hypothetical protein